MKKLTNDEFISKSIQIHGNKYDYSLTNFLNVRTRIKIILDGVIYEQLPYAHLFGKCPENIQNIKTEEEFINECKKVHNNKYDYSLLKYTGNKNKIKIIYNGNIYTQIASDHLRGHEPKLISSTESIGVKTIKKYLDDKSINYVREFCFKDCKHLSTLYFDFYLPRYNITIEYDGRQHFESVPYFGGELGLQKTKERDKSKNEYTQKNNISLFRVCYLDDIIYKLDMIFKNYDI